MSSSYCPYCKAHWPREAEFESCPCCREETRLSQDPAKPETWPDDPAKLAFGWWLWDNGHIA